MPYWYRYQRGRSVKNIVKDRLIEKSEIITKLKKLEDLNYNDLKIQKDLYEDELRALEEKYPVNIFKNNLKKISLARKNIEKKLTKNEIKLEKISKNLKNKTSYYIEDKSFFAKKKVVSSIILKNITAEDIFKIEKENFDIINEKEFQVLLSYFKNLNEIIFNYFHIFNIDIFENNLMSWDQHVLEDNHFVNPYDFIKKYNLTFSIYIYKKFVELYEKDISNYLEHRYMLDENQNYILQKPFFYDDASYIEYDKYLVDEDSWGDYYHRIDETIYSKKLKNNNKIKSIHFSIRKFQSYEKKLLSNQKIYKKFYENSTELLKRYLRKIELLIRSKILKSEKKTNQGKVYVMKNKGFPGMYKIGSTYGSVDKRAEELSGTNTPYPWVHDYHIKMQDAEYYEKQIHKLLKDYRFRKDREFFRLDISKIRKCLNEVSKISEKGKNKISTHIIKKNVNL